MFCRAHTVVLLSKKSSRVLAVGKQKTYDICVGKKFREPTSKEFFTSKFNVANEDRKKVYT